MNSGRPNDTLRDLIARTGLTINAFAREAGITDRHIRNMLAGRHDRPRWETRAAIERVLRENGVAVDGVQNLGFMSSSRRTVTTGAETEDETVEILRRELLGLSATAVFGSALGGPVADAVRIRPAERATTIAVGINDVNRVRATFESVSGTGSLMGGGALSQSVLLDEFRAALGLLHGTFRSADTRAKAHAAVGNLSQAVGVQLFDQCEHHLARRVWVTGLQVAQQAGAESGPCQGYLLHLLAYQERFLGNPQRALSLLGLMSGQERELSGQTRAMLNVMRAETSADLGDFRGTLGYIAAADELYDDTAEPESWNPRHWFDRSHVDGSNGRALATLAVTRDQLRDDALQRLTEAVAKCKGSEQRTRARQLIASARIHAVRRDPESTVTVTMNALSTTSQIRSRRVHKELRDLLPALRPMRRHSDVAQAMHDIDQMSLN